MLRVVVTAAAAAAFEPVSSLSCFSQQLHSPPPHVAAFSVYSVVVDGLSCVDNRAPSLPITWPLLALPEGAYLPRLDYERVVRIRGILTQYRTVVGSTKKQESWPLAGLCFLFEREGAFHTPFKMTTLGFLTFLGPSLTNKTKHDS